MSAAAVPHSRAPALDTLRAGAAALVLLSHGRSLLFEDAAPGLSWSAAAFYGVSGLGHQAVIVFFVLSGLVVTESMLRLTAAGRWSLRTFAVARLTRLWIVLAPCLVLGALLDRLGLGVVGPMRPYGLAPLGHPATAPNLDLPVALGNLVFLQTVSVPVLGSNGPLWSLSNEAWYYAMAALGFAAWQARNSAGRALALASAAVALGALLPRPMIELAPVWGSGALVAVMRHRAPGAAAAMRRPVGWFGALLLAVALPASRLHSGLSSLAADLTLGMAVAAILLARPAHHRPGVPGRAASAVRRLADASYSLYLSHLPVLALFAALTVGPRRLPAGSPAFLRLGLGLALATGVGFAVWWAFERHTDRLRSVLSRRASPLPGSVARSREVVP